MAGCLRNLPTSYKLLLLIYMNTIIYTTDDIIKLKNELKTLQHDHPISYCAFIKSNPELLAFVKQQTPLLQDSFYTMPTKVYWILNDMTDFPVCSHCGKKLDMRNVNKQRGYSSVCSRKCSALSIERKQKIKQTCLAKYGVEHVSQTNQFKEKYKQTCLEKYGKTHSFAATSVKEKTKQTWLKRHGVSNIAQSPACKEQVKQTMLTRYSVAYMMQAEQFKTKSKQTCLKRYGVENPNQTKAVKDKIKSTCQARYGVKYPLQNKDIREKHKKTMLARYGVEHPSQNRDIRIKQQRRYCFEDVNFDSAPELALYIYLKDHNIPFTYQPETDFWYTFNNKRYKYMPDFKINDRYVEIKGNHLLDKETNTWVNPWNSDLDELYEAKHQCCLDNNVKILYTEDYQQYLDYINKRYSTKHLQQFKKE